jgi:hypothetical protein
MVDHQHAQPALAGQAGEEQPCSATAYDDSVEITPHGYVCDRDSVGSVMRFAHRRGVDGLAADPAL